ncbi:hypothetical protein ElyMa_004685200 [Elysia marginata]|uniref:Uncharacterized protein n=1 Tax=Elysia marginata TaxID=1093978 RepID=A0AAV4I6A3_9GAST|nr:hypothetical protein ElyMa_004685200 [Elysia marginata]
MTAIAGFVNPFEVDGGLICLSSGQSVLDDLATNLVSVQHQGEQEFDNFVEKRLQSKFVSFHDPIKKKKMTTFSCLNKQKKKNKKSNEFKRIKVTAQRNMFGQLLMVSQTHDIDLAKVMTYPLNLFPWSLATSDGSLMKTNKAVLLHKLEEAKIALTSRHPEISDIHVIEGNALLQSLLGLPDTFGELALKVFTCLPSASVVHFVTDRYDDLSIKDIERMRRGQDDCNTHSIRGPENYQSMVWRWASQAHPKLPNPENNGWKLSERGRLEINWCDGDIFPNEIEDILSKNDAVEDSDDDQDSVASDDIEWLSESEEDITDSDTD